MSSAHPFDELGRIIASGGIRSAAWGLRNVGGGIKLVNWFRSRFPSLSQTQAGSLATMANAYRGAGNLLQLANPTDRIDPNTLPVVPGGSGTANALNQFWSDVRITWLDHNTGRTSIMTFGIGTDQPPSSQELASLAEIASQGPLQESLPGGTWTSPPQVSVIDVYISGVLRQW